MPEKKSHRLAVIGGGPGGYAAAFKAADLGMEVTLIEESPFLGGVCLHSGCIPSKALLHVADVLEETRQASQWGIHFNRPTIDLEILRRWKQKTINTLAKGLKTLSTSRSINRIQGHARFIDHQTLQIQYKDGKEETWDTDYSIIATGSTPMSLPIPIADARIMDSTSALALHDIPKSLLIVGGGYIGLELATVYQALGSNITVVEMAAELLSGVDPDLVSILQEKLTQRSIALTLETKVTQIVSHDTSLEVTTVDKEEQKRVLNVEKVLVAIGRKPNTGALDLQHTNVRLDDKGFIEVDERRATTDDCIFAIGDVAGEPMLAHKATHEGIVAAEAIAGHHVTFQPQAIPAVVFTDPEIAWCGITESQAKERGIPIKVTRFPWSASGRAITLGSHYGLTKLILEAKTERIIGVAICGKDAGTLISEGTLAIEMAALASDLQATIHPHPTLSETLMEAAELIHGSSMHIYRQ